MEPRWPVIIACLFGILIFVLMLGFPGHLAALCASLKDIGPAGSTADKTFGLVLFGFIGILIVAIVKILTQNRNP